MIHAHPDAVEKWTELAPPTFPQRRRLLLLSLKPKGDISTLENRGHFYFGLTGKWGREMGQKKR